MRAGFDDRDDGLGVFEDPADLPLRRRVVDRNGSGAGSPDGEVEERPLVSGRGEECDAVACLHASGDETVCDAGDLLGELFSRYIYPTLSLGRENTVSSGVRSA